MQMCTRAFKLALSVFAGWLIAIASPQNAAASDAGAAFPYRSELAERGYSDVVALATGEKISGKVLEWAGEILVFDAAANILRFPVRDVESIDLRRNDRHNAPFAKADLTVAYVERLPRDPSWHGHVTYTNGLPSLDIDPNAAPWHPKAGDSATFRVHILNAGGADSVAASCGVSFDGKPSDRTATIPPLKPGAEHIFDVKWSWAEGQHELKIEIDPEGKTPDALRWNNTFTQPTRGLAIAFVVARDRYEAHKATPNMVDSFCFEDFAQYTIRSLNALLAASVYPSAPNGAEERLYCDRIVVVEDPMDASKESSWLPSLHRGGKAEELPEYAAIARFGTLSKKAVLIRETALVNWAVMQSIGGQIGLADLKRIETSLEQCYVFDTYDRYAMLQYLSPWRASLMHTPGGFVLTEEQVGFLNHTIGRPRGFLGDYHYQLPAKISLKILANNGLPLKDVQVDVFQLMTEGPDAGRITGIGRSDPIFSSISNEGGIAELINLDAPSHKTPGGYELAKNPFGKIACDGSNGLLLLRLRSPAGNEEFDFFPLVDCNVAYLRGQNSDFVHTIPTRFGTPAATIPPPPFAAIEMWDRKTDKPPLQLTWVIPKEIDPKNIEEFRVYKRTGFAGQQAKPWTLVSVHKPPAPRNFPHGAETYFDELRYDGPYSLDTFFAVSSVDFSGQESGLSEPGYIPFQKEAIRFAVGKNQAFMTARGRGQTQMLYWDGRAGTQPHQMKLDAVKGYKPAFEGIAFAPDGRLVVTDPENHVLAFYDSWKSELLEVLPKRATWPGQPGDKPGEFNSPADVAVDDSGNIYVADRNNHRVQILDSRGEPKGLLDPDFRFRHPFAIAYSTGYISVTDKNGTRCRIYDIKSAEPKLAIEMSALVDADRAVVNAKGRIFVTGRLDKDAELTMLSFDQDGQGSAYYTGTGLQSEMGPYQDPRSIYQHRGNPLYIYMVNEFPFDVRRLHIDQ